MLGKSILRAMNRPGRTRAIPALLLLTAGLGGCGATYGTGESPEMQLFSEMTGGLMDRDKKEPINYNPRAPLVMPPTQTAGALPPPVQTASAANANWPMDPDEISGGANIPEDDNPQNDINQAEYRRLLPLAGALPRAQDNWPDNSDNNMDDEARDIIHSRAQQEEVRRAITDAEGFTRTERRFLTDPPLDYREPSATAPVGAAAVPKKRNFLARWFSAD
jgi:hypothetical protein